MSIMDHAGLYKVRIHVRMCSRIVNARLVGDVKICFLSTSESNFITQQLISLQEL